MSDFSKPPETGPAIMTVQGASSHHMSESVIDLFTQQDESASSDQFVGDLAPEPVNGDALLNELTATIRRHVVMEHGAAEATALWVLHTYALDAFVISPRLAITSPVMRCGKTTLLDVLSRLVRSPMTTVNTTAAALFHLVDTMSPTLLIDEADTFLSKNGDLRGILNSGHRRNSALVLRVDGSYSTFAAAAIAMIGCLPATLEDRSIPIRLQRRRADEVVVPFRCDQTPGLDHLASMAARWAADNYDRLKAADPMVPSILENREADNWRPLLAIADVAGGEWPMRARQFAELLTARNRGSEQSAGVMVLEDIFTIFMNQSAKRLTSEQLVTALAQLEARPWSEWIGAKPITKTALAGLLAPFRIAPIEMRMGPKVLRGYQIEQIEDAFARYVAAAASQTATPLQDETPASDCSGVADTGQQSSNAGGADGKRRLDKMFEFVSHVAVGERSVPVFRLRKPGKAKPCASAGNEQRSAR